MHKNAARQSFNEMISQLQKLKRSPRAPQVKGLLGDTFNENSSFG
jgi:hypothetical protein